MLRQEVLAKRGVLSSVLEDGLAAEDDVAVGVAMDGYATHRGVEALAERCAALLARPGEGPPSVRSGDARPALWLESLGRGGSVNDLRRVRRWATAVDTEGRPPAGGGGLSVVNDEAAGGLAGE